MICSASGEVGIGLRLVHSSLCLYVHPANHTVRSLLAYYFINPFCTVSNTVVSRSRRRRVEPRPTPRRRDARETSTASEFDLGPIFVPTMNPPPYDADKPPAYTTAANADVGGATGTVSGAPADAVKPPSPDD